MRITRLLKSESIRVAAITATLFTLTIGAFTGVVLWIVSSNQRAALMHANEDEIGSVLAGYQQEGLGEAKEVLMVDYAGAPVTICFNAQYVLDFLAAVSTDVVSLELKDEVSQAVMKPVGAEGYDYTYVIMPMRV